MGEVPGHHTAGFVAAAVFAIAVNSTAHAQIVGLSHVWTVPGAMNTGNGVGTFISCTNGSTLSTTVGVDVYGPSGAYVTPFGANSITVGPNATVIFGTSGASGISVDVNMGLPIVNKGHARILASSSKGLVCSAFLADANGGVPASMTTLTVAKAFKQKGD